MAKVFASSSCFRASNILDAVRALSTITPYIELSGGTSHQDGLLNELVLLKKAHGLTFIVHSYFPPPKEHFTLNFADTSARTREFISRAVRYAMTLGSTFYTIHAGFHRTYAFDGERLINPTGDNHTLDEILGNLDWFYSTFPHMGLALENLYPNDGNTGCCFMMRPEDISELLRMEPRVGLLLDLGHLKVAGTLLGFDYAVAAHDIMREFGDRLVEVHVSENRGTMDDHLPITEGSYQYEFLAIHANTIKQAGTHISLEVRGHGLDDVAGSLQLIRQALKL